MSALILPRRFEQQPQEAADISPLWRSRGAVWAFVPASSDLYAVGSVPQGPTPVGMAKQFASSAYLRRDTAPTVDPNEFTVFVLARNGSGGRGRMFSMGNSSDATRFIFLSRESSSSWTAMSQGSTTSQIQTLTYTPGVDEFRPFLYRRSLAANTSYVRGGDTITSTTCTNVGSATHDRVALGCLLRTSAADFFNGEIAAAVLFDRAISKSEESELFGNPWQIFSRQPLRLFVGVPASGSATGTGSPADVTTNPPTGAATGSATASGALAAITLAPAEGSASAATSATASGAFAALTIAPPAGTATGSATAAGTPAGIILAPAEGTATGTTAGGATAVGALAAITITPPAGTATGDATAAGTPAGVTLTPPQGTAGAVTNATAVGALAAITLTPALGAATGAAEAAGLFAVVTITAPTSGMTPTSVSTDTPPPLYAAQGIRYGTFEATPRALVRDVSARNCTPEITPRVIG